MQSLAQLRRQVAQLSGIFDKQTAYELATMEDAPHIESTCVSNYTFVPDEEDPVYGTLTITFTGPPYGGAGTWEYYLFPVSEYVLFAKSNSLGTYFNLYIRDQGYSYERIA